MMTRTSASSGTSITSARFWVIVGLLFLVGTTLLVSADKEIEAMKRSRKRCGTYLTETLKSLCKNGYNVMVDKRSDEYADEPQGVQYQIPGFPIISRPETSLLRYRRGIIEECCYTQCTVKHLLEYCKETPEEKSFSY